MLVIRNRQLEALRAEALGAFVDRMVAFIAADYASTFRRLGELEVRRLIEHGLEVGGRHGIADEGGLSALVELILQYGRDFELAPDRAWARRLLEHPTLPGQLKIQLLCERMAAKSRGRVVVLMGAGPAEGR